MVAIEADVSWHSDIVRFGITRMLTFQCTMLQSANILFAVVQTKINVQLCNPNEDTIRNCLCN